MAHVLFRNLHLLGNLTIIKWSAIWYIPTGEKAQPSYYRALYKWKTLEQKLLKIACRVILKGF